MLLPSIWSTRGRPWLALHVAAESRMPQCRGSGKLSQGNYSDTSKGEYDGECRTAWQGFHLYSKFQQKHVQTGPADDEMPEMIGRVFTSCSEATFDVDGRWSEHGVLWCGRRSRWAAWGQCGWHLGVQIATPRRRHSSLQQGPLTNALGGRRRPVEGAAAPSPDPRVSHPPSPSPSIRGEGRSARVVPSHGTEASRGGNRDEPAVLPSSPSVAVPGPDPGEGGSDSSRGGNRNEPAVPPSSPGVAVPGPNPGAGGSDSHSQAPS